MKTLTTTILSLTIALAGTMNGAQAANLLEIYQQARDTDPDYRAGVANVQGQRETAKQTTAEWLPQLAIIAQWQRSMPGSREFSSFTADMPTNSWSATLRLSQTIFDGVKLVNYKAGELYDLKADIDAADAEQSLIVRATEAYLSYLQAKNKVTYAQAEIAALNSQSKEVQQRFDVGLIAITDLRETQARNDFSAAQLLLAEHEFESAKDILNEIFGGNVGSLPDFKADMVLATPEPNDLDQWISAGLSNNLQRKRLQVDGQLAAGNIKRQKAKYLPVVMATAEYVHTDADVFANGTFISGGESTDRRIGVNVNIPLYTGGRTRSQLREANAKELEVQQQLESNKRSVQRSIRSNFRGTVTAIRQTEALQKALESSDVALDAINAGYDAGTRTITDVLNAKRDVLKAQRDYSDARYDYVNSMVALLRSAGTLTPQHVLALNSQLTDNGLADKVSD